MTERWALLPAWLLAEFCRGSADEQARKALLRRGFALEYATFGWNVAGIAVLAAAAISAQSVALAGWPSIR